MSNTAPKSTSPLPNICVSPHLDEKVVNMLVEDGYNVQVGKCELFTRESPPPPDIFIVSTRTPIYLVLDPHIEPGTDFDITCSTKMQTQNIYIPTVLKLNSDEFKHLNWILTCDPKFQAYFEITTLELHCSNLLRLYDKVFFPQCSTPIFLYLSYFHLTFIHEETPEIYHTTSLNDIVQSYLPEIRRREVLISSAKSLARLQTTGISHGVKTILINSLESIPLHLKAFQQVYASMKKTGRSAQRHLNAHRKGKNRRASSSTTLAEGQSYGRDNVSRNAVDKVATAVDDPNYFIKVMSEIPYLQQYVNTNSTKRLRSQNQDLQNFNETVSKNNIQSMLNDGLFLNSFDQQQKSSFEDPGSTAMFPPPKKDHLNAKKDTTIHSLDKVDSKGMADFQKFAELEKTVDILETLGSFDALSKMSISTLENSFLVASALRRELGNSNDTQTDAIVKVKAITENCKKKQKVQHNSRQQETLIPAISSGSINSTFVIDANTSQDNIAFLRSKHNTLQDKSLIAKNLLSASMIQTAKKRAKTVYDFFHPQNITLFNMQ